MSSSVLYVQPPCLMRIPRSPRDCPNAREKSTLLKWLGLVLHPALCPKLKDFGCIFHCLSVHKIMREPYKIMRELYKIMREPYKIVRVDNRQKHGRRIPIISITLNSLVSNFYSMTTWKVNSTNLINIPIQLAALKLPHKFSIALFNVVLLDQQREIMWVQLHPREKKYQHSFSDWGTTSRKVKNLNTLI